MENARIYGSPPYRVAVLHGGPGAPGDVEPVAVKLGKRRGVLEPLQSAASLEEQVEELRAQLEKWADPPVILIGHSWGAWLAWLLSARYPSLVRELVLVSSGAFEEAYAEGLMDTRRARLSRDERSEVDGILGRMNAGDAGDDLLARFGALMDRADSYDLLPVEDGHAADCDMTVFQRVWPEGAALRRSGQLLALGRGISCPVVAVHGDHDPSPAEGVEEPLSRVLDDFRFILLERCGHTPWRERHAREPFYRILNAIIDGSTV